MSSVPPTPSCTIGQALRESAKRPAVFSTVYEAFAKRVLASTMRLTLDAELAAEMTAETFAKAFQKRAQFRGSNDAEALGWMLAIAQREFANYVRRGVVARKAVDRLGIEVPPLTPDDIAWVEQMVDMSAIRGVLTAALQKLPENQRDALNLRVVEQLPYEEVATRLEITAETARTRVSRALKQLRAELDNLEVDVA